MYMLNKRGNKIDRMLPGPYKQHWNWGTAQLTLLKVGLISGNATSNSWFCSLSKRPCTLPFVIIFSSVSAPFLDLHLAGALHFSNFLEECSPAVSVPCHWALTEMTMSALLKETVCTPACWLSWGCTPYSSITALRWIHNKIRICLLLKARDLSDTKQR